MTFGMNEQGAGPLPESRRLLCGWPRWQFRSRGGFKATELVSSRLVKNAFVPDFRRSRQADDMPSFSSGRAIGTARSVVQWEGVKR